MGGGGVDSLASFHLPGAIFPKFCCMQSKTLLQFYLMLCTYDVCLHVCLIP